MAGARQAKRDLRKEMNARLNLLSETDVATQSEKVTQRVLAMPEYQRARKLGVYLSMPTSELSTHHIVTEALTQGKAVFVPYLHKTSQHNGMSGKMAMSMLSLHSLEDFESLQPDAWGIPTLEKSSVTNRRNAHGGLGLEHRERMELADRLDLILVPGVAFDREHRRLGHGKGFYDRFLHDYKEALEASGNGTDMPFLLALALQEQILPQGQEVPVTETDWLMDAVVSAGNV